MAEKKKRSLLIKGLMTFGIGFVINMILMTLNLGGLIREAARLTVIVGFFMILVALVKKVFCLLANLFNRKK